MTRRPAHVPLNVFINGRLVGVLRREATGAIDFRYDAGWLTWESTFPVSLSLPLREDRYIGTPVINVFENLLPDSEAIRRRVAERVGARGIDAYSLLAALGQDCVGALQFLPDNVDPGPAGTTDGRPLSGEELGNLIGNLAVAPLGLDEDADFRISIAGAQEKTALLRKDGRWFKPVGTAPTTHILKPQIGQLPNGIDLSNSVENEYLCLKLLAAFGVPSAAAEMAEFGGRRTLIVERFDRRWTKDDRLIRLPQEDCCQALSVPPTRKYQGDGGPGLHDILTLLRGSDTPEEDIAVFLRSNIIFWMLGATDGHAKNFSIFLSPGGRFRLTPLYDVISVQPSLDAGHLQIKQFRLAMAAGSKNHYRMADIMPRHFLQTAERAGIGASLVRSIFDDLAANAERWTDDVIAELPNGFPADMTTSIRAGIVHRAELLVRNAAIEEPADGA